MKILLYCDWQLAFTYLEPVYDYLTKSGMDCAFYLNSGLNNDALVRSLYEERGYQFTHDLRRYDYAICCDTRSACPRENRIVLFHGLASKSQDFSSHRADKAIGVHAAPSAWYANILLDKQRIPPAQLFRAGLSKWDILTDAELARERREVPKVLYAPTFGKWLSSVDVLGDSINEIEHTEHKHHPVSKDLTNHHVTMNVECCYGADKSAGITRLMADADIVIADYGSTVVEAIALGKMTIQVVNPLAAEMHAARGTTGELFEALPEIYLPKRYGFQANNIEDIKRIMTQYPDYKTPDFEVVENIGEYRVSQQILRYIRGEL